MIQSHRRLSAEADSGGRGRGPLAGVDAVPMKADQVRAEVGDIAHDARPPREKTNHLLAPET